MLSNILIKLVEFVTLLGILGAGLILLAFVLNEFNIINKDNLSYDMLNFIGALILVIYAYLIESYPFMVLNLIWMLVSFRDLWKRMKS